MLTTQRETLVIKTIEQAIKRSYLKTGMLFHSNRGSQYILDAVMSLLKKHGIKQSFSSGDNLSGLKIANIFSNLNNTVKSYGTLLERKRKLKEAGKDRRESLSSDES